MSQKYIELKQREDEETDPPKQLKEILVEANDESPLIDGNGNHEFEIPTDHDREWSGIIPNLDQFFQQVYIYFLEKGFLCIVISRLMELFKVFFMMIFTTFLFLCIDWYGLWKCTGIGCEKSFVNFKLAYTNIGWYHYVVYVSECLIGIYGFYLLVKYISEINAMRKIRHYYNNEWNISEEELQTIRWDEVVYKIVEYQRKNKLSLVKLLTEHDIVNRIMRKENYLIAFINKDILNLRIPFSKNNVLTESLLWNIRYIIDSIFDDQLSIKDSILQSPRELRKKFILLGFVNIIVAPFVFLILFIYFFFKYTAEIKNSPASLLDRRWSTFALWKFREFNELPHIFDERIRKSYKPAREYCKQFPARHISIIGKTIMFISSALIAIIIVLSAVKYPLLLHTQFFGNNLLWWLAVLLVVYTSAKGQVIDKEAVFDPNSKMEQVAIHTHYLPKRWRNKAHHPQVRDEFMTMFRSYIELFIQEMLSILITPIILIFSLPKSAEKIVQFVNDNTIVMDGVGDVCGFATFNFREYGNCRYGSSVHAEKAHRTANGKMEKSFLNFKANYPRWNVNDNYDHSIFLNNLKNSMIQSMTIQSPSIAMVSESIPKEQTKEQITQKVEQMVSSNDYFKLIENYYKQKIGSSTVKFPK